MAAASVRSVDDIIIGADGRGRCGWAGATADYLAYHDDEWGVPQRDEVRLFEKLCLEAFQSGLSWLTILRKREAFRAAFAGFVPERVAAFGPADVRAAARRPRHRPQPGQGGGVDRQRAGHRWSCPTACPRCCGPSRRTRRPAPRPRSFAEVPATTAESTAMARELRRRGFRFVGPTTAYALMQACGLVDDHLTAAGGPPRRRSRRGERLSGR